MAKIALFTAQPNKDRRVAGFEFNVGEKRPPHGLGYMMAILEQAGHDVVIFDRYANNLRWDAGDFSSYDLAGIYCTTVCMDDVKDIILRLKAKRIAVGGPHWSALPVQGKGERWFDKIHYVIKGEGEKIINKLITEPVPDCQIICETPRLTDFELGKLPRFPWGYFWEKNRAFYHWSFPFKPALAPVFTMNTSRGCPFSCAFCAVKKVWGTLVTFFSAERIYEDIKYLKATYSAAGIYFREDNFTVNNQRIRNFCDLLLKNNLKVEWSCETRVDTVDRELMILMKRAGCIGFYVGVEHGSQKILDILNKGISVEQIIRFFDDANQLGIRTAASMIINHPAETKDDNNKFWQLLNRIKPTFIWKNEYRKDG